MLVRRYQGNDIEAIQEQINQELGPEAVILATREIDNGVLHSLLYEPELEVTVGVEPADLKEYNPNFEAPEGFEQLHVTPFHQNTKVACSGPITPDPDEVTLVAVVGLKEQALADSCIRMAQMFHQETPYRSVLFSVKEVHDSIPHEFNRMAEQKNLPYDVVLDRLHLLDAISKYNEHDLIILKFPESMHPLQVKGFLKGIKPLWIQVVVDNGQDYSAYKHLHPQGVIVNQIDSETVFDILPSKLKELGLPISYYKQGDKLVAAEPETLETQIINSRLKTT